MGRLRWLSTSADTQGDGRPLCEAAYLCMKLVQILLPVRDNHGRKFKPILYAKIHKQLVKRFGGLTAHTRSPARGLWNSEGSTKRDDMIILEVMTKRFDRAWWKRFRATLEKAFRQEEIVVRAHNITQL